MFTLVQLVIKFAVWPDGIYNFGFPPQHPAYFVRKTTLKNSRKNQNQLEVHVGSDEMTFPLLSLSYESFSVSCFFIRLLLTKRDATFSSVTNTVSVLVIGKFIRWSFHFSAFLELSQSATMKPF